MKFKSPHDAIVYFTECQAKMLEKEQELKELMNKYKQETKEYFGVADGEPANLIQLATLMSKFIPGTKILDDHEIGGAPV